ncbi:hypothetical protein Q7P37_008186 [Cladosporium fusiforme]
MPSIAESKRQVAEGLSNTDFDHDAILASLHDEIDRHNRESEDRREDRGKSRDSHKRRRRHGDHDDTSDHKRRRDKHLRFRFKSGVKEPTPKRSKRSKRHSSQQPNEEEDDAAATAEPTAHPFPREPISPSPSATTAPTEPQPSNAAAFRTSLFDALADDEAAAYWESVYSQPIHIYTRPKVSHDNGQNPASASSGGVQDMDDETYAAYVQRRMWEKQNPEIMLERERMEEKRREEADAKKKRKEAFVHARRREAWERAGRAKVGDDDDEDGQFQYDYMFDREDSHRDPSSKKTQETQQDYHLAWTTYLSAWEALKTSLANPSSSSTTPPPPPSKRIPWPTLHARPATKPNIEAFMRHAPPPDRLQSLKAERVRWHPDKVQQRFGGAVDEGTMKVVTGIFQVVDALVEEERGRVSA